MTSTTTTSNNNTQALVDSQSEGELARAACGTCAVSSSCSLDGLRLLPNGVIEDSNDLDRFLKTVRKPDDVKRISELLGNQARTVPPRIVPAGNPIDYDSTDNR